MKALLPFLLTVATATSPLLKTGDTLPLLRGEFLNGKEARLPEAAQGKVAFLMLGFSYDSRFPVEQWASRFREEFGNHPGVTFYEIPMIGGMARMGKWFIDGGMRRGTPKSDYEHVITVYGGTDPWKQRLAVRNEKDAYLLLLDPAGNIVWRYSGKYDAAEFQKLAAEVNRLTAPGTH